MNNATMQQQLEHAHALVTSASLQMVDISDHMFDDLFQTCYAELQQNTRAIVEMPASHLQRRIEIYDDNETGTPMTTSSAPAQHAWNQRVFHWQHLHRLEILEEAPVQQERVVIDLTGEE